MKRLKVFAFVSLLLLTCSAGAVAADLYALGAKVPILAEPKLGATKVAEARRGERMSGSEELKGWYRVTFADKSGWVSRLLLGTKPPTAGGSILDTEDDEDLEGNARRRASSFTTAAAARGLSEDRTRVSQKYRLDYSGLAWMERQIVTEEEGINFIGKRGGAND